MALQQEIWVKDIQELLFPPNSVLSRATNDSGYVHYKTVHVPSAGNNAGISKNRTVDGSFATTGYRTDNDVTYTIDSYSVDPVVVSDLDTFQLAYDKRKSILYNSMMNLETIMANNFLYGIAPDVSNATASIFYTTGATQAIDLAYNPVSGTASTGVRNSVTLQDIFTIKTALDKQNVPQEGRVLLVPSDIFNNELLQIDQILNAYQLGMIAANQAVVQTGTLAKVAGFEIMTRPTTVIYDMTGATGSRVASGLAAIDGSGNPTVTANASTAILAWHPTTVSHAQGEIKAFYTENFAPLYGSVISFDIWAGSGKRRYDKKGIVALVQRS